MFRSTSACNAGRPGYTLTEMSIVLAVAGLIMAGIWGIASVVREKIRREQAIDQIITVVQKTREYYLGRGDIAGAGDATDALIRVNVIPQEMVSNRSVPPPPLFMAQNPWFGAFTVDDNVAGDPPGGARWQSFRITTQNLDYGQCVEVVTRVTGPSGPSGLMGNGTSMNGTATPVPVTTDYALANCQPAGNVLTFAFRLRQQ